MDPQRWERIKSIFDAAVQGAPADRRAIVDELCGPDSDLRAEVDRLLALHRAGTDGAGTDAPTADVPGKHRVEAAPTLPRPVRSATFLRASDRRTPGGRWPSR
jgi:hypothetical protein